MDEVETVEVERRRRRRWPWVAAGIALLVLLALLILWLMRFMIVDDMLRDEFERRGVQASYDVTRIGFRTQRLENVVIGDPSRPDLTADWIEVDLGLGFHSPTVDMIRARGVRMRGRIVDGRLTLGDIDKLLPPPSGLPFRLPDQRVDVADAAISLETPAGPIGIGISGRGNLSHGFQGHMAAVGRRLQFGECLLVRPRADVDVQVNRHRPRFRGPAATEGISCGEDFLLAQPRLQLDVTLAQAFDAWQGRGDATAARLAAGGNLLSGLRGNLTFRGDVERTTGDMAVRAAGVRAGGFRIGPTQVNGHYFLSMSHGDIALAGDASMRGVVLPDSLTDPVAEALRSAGGTPVEPIGEALAAAVDRAEVIDSLRGDLRLVNGHGFGAIRFERLQAATRSGARIAVSGGTGLTYYWPGDGVRLDGNVALTGGGFPNTRLTFNQARAGGPVEGIARVEPMRVRGASLALSDIRFTAEGGRTRVDTVARMDGPFDAGTVTGLVLPVSGHFANGGFAFGQTCVRARFERLQVQSLRLGAAAFPLCPSGRALLWKEPGGRVQGGGVIGRPQLAGQLGSTPIRIASDRLGFTLRDKSFTSSDVAIRLGTAPDLSRLDMDRFSGRFDARGVGGRFAGLSGDIANVPLLVSQGAGDWRLQSGELTMRGGLQVADRSDAPRFYPLVSDDFRLRLYDNDISAGGTLRHPDSGTTVTQATIAHDLATGIGRAVLDVPGIRFDQNLQPDDITPLTTGVVALVDGTVTGRGEIDWSPQGTTSTGTFSTEGMDLAAPFGPVEGLTTSITFTDLLGLVSAPGQVARTDVIRAGINVLDGEIRYQLLPDLRIRVEGARWPFAGGYLILEETILDFSQPSTKRLTFRVEGLEAAAFVQQMEFANIAATGTFDGTIPMEFDISGGRVVGGYLEARPGGGTLSYIGELTDRELGIYGEMAFDALKSLRYSRLTIRLDGALAGEFVTRIQMDGVARDPTLTGIEGGGITGMIARRALSQLARIPFRFNIRIEGPLRAVIGTARSLEDPSLLIQPVLPEMLQDLPTTVAPIETEESEDVP